jgi:hypothetical protein
MIRLSRRNLLKIGLVFVAAVIAMELLGRFIESRDTVLPRAEKFLREAPQVHRAVGEIKSVSLKKSLYYEGVPEQEAPYREYSFGVSGKPIWMSGWCTTTASARTKVRCAADARLCKL